MNPQEAYEELVRALRRYRDSLPGQDRKEALVLLRRALEAAEREAK